MHGGTVIEHDGPASNRFDAGAFLRQDIASWEAEGGATTRARDVRAATLSRNATALVSSGRWTRDYRCETCGYQIAIPQPHPVCPMCGEHFWTLIAAARQSWQRNVRADRAPLVTG